MAAGDDQKAGADLPTKVDVEKQQSEEQVKQKKSVYAGLGWLDRLLVLWILLAIIIGILLGNFVDGVGPALQKGKFVQVSVPIGEYHRVDTLVCSHN
jgi:ACR3 family arsenite transporter